VIKKKEKKKLRDRVLNRNLMRDNSSRDAKPLDQPPLLSGEGSVDGESLFTLESNTGSLSTAALDELGNGEQAKEGDKDESTSESSLSVGSTGEDSLEDL